MNTYKEKNIKLAKKAYNTLSNNEKTIVNSVNDLINERVSLCKKSGAKIISRYDKEIILKYGFYCNKQITEARLYRLSKKAFQKVLKKIASKWNSSKIYAYDPKNDFC